MICTRELAETIAFGFSCFPVEHETGLNVRLRDAKAETLIGHTPKAYDLADRFENVDELILCSRVRREVVGDILGLDVPRPCYTGHFRLARG